MQKDQNVSSPWTEIEAYSFRRDGFHESPPLSILRIRCHQQER